MGSVIVKNKQDRLGLHIPIISNLLYKNNIDDKDLSQNEDGTYSAKNEGKGKRKLHHVTIRNLKPDNEYQFSIAGKILTFDKDGSTKFRTVKTAKVMDELKTPDPLYGQVKLRNEKDEGIIYFYLADTTNIFKSQLLSSRVSNGTYTFDLNSLKFASLDKLFTVSAEKRIFNFEVVDDDKKSTFSRIQTKTYKPIDTINVNNINDENTTEINRSIFPAIILQTIAYEDEDTGGIAPKSNGSSCLLDAECTSGTCRACYGINKTCVGVECTDIPTIRCGDGQCLAPNENDRTCPVDCTVVLQPKKPDGSSCQSYEECEGYCLSCPQNSNEKYCVGSTMGADQVFSAHCSADSYNLDDPVASNCGDGQCSYSENSYTCPEDCGIVTKCGDNICNVEKDENHISCPQDCDNETDPEIKDENENKVEDRPPQDENLPEMNLTAIVGISTDDYTGIRNIELQACAESTRAGGKGYSIGGIMYAGDGVFECVQWTSCDTYVKYTPPEGREGEIILDRCLRARDIQRDNLEIEEEVAVGLDIYDNCILTEVENYEPSLSTGYSYRDSNLGAGVQSLCPNGKFEVHPALDIIYYDEGDLNNSNLPEIRWTPPDSFDVLECQVYESEIF